MRGLRNEFNKRNKQLQTASRILIERRSGGFETTQTLARDAPGELQSERESEKKYEKRGVKVH
jgi:hypothetical protein